MLMELVTKMISIEAENKRLDAEGKFNNYKIWGAIFTAFLSAVAAIIVALNK